jgi:ATP-dependent RNA helicase DeaD
MEKVPTVADLRARRLELTRAALRESLLEDSLDGFRAVVEALTDEFDVMEVAAAAVKLAHEASAGGGPDDDSDIPQVAARLDDRPARTGPPSRSEAGPARKGRALEGPTAKLYVGLGRAAGVRPQDLVGAITGESSLSGRQIGGIEITERFSLVEVPEPAAQEVITALRGTLIKGRKASVRRDAKS